MAKEVTPLSIDLNDICLKNMSIIMPDAASEDKEVKRIKSMLTSLKNAVLKEKASSKDGKVKVKKPVVSKQSLLSLLQTVQTLFLKEKTLIDVQPPFTVCGDLHGQMTDLLTILEKVGYPPQTRYLFTGDYVDRGDHSIELVIFLFGWKVMHPDHIIMLRGNHETAEVNALYGFKDDCLDQYDLSVWEAFTDCFNCLPLACLIGSKILCMHGGNYIVLCVFTQDLPLCSVRLTFLGLSPSFTSLDQVRNIPRPLDIPQSGLTCDLLWSDPTPDNAHDKNCGYTPNTSRNTSVWFCKHAVNEFLKKHSIERIVRGHETPDEGFSFSCDNRVVTLFTAPRYCGGTNDSAIMHIDKDFHFSIESFAFDASQIGSGAKQVADELTKRENKKT